MSSTNSGERPAEEAQNREAQSRHVCAPGYQGPDRRRDGNGYDGGGGNRNGENWRQAAGIGTVVTMIATLLGIGGAWLVIQQTAVNPLAERVAGIDQRHMNEIVNLQSRIAERTLSYNELRKVVEDMRVTYMSDQDKAELSKQMEIQIIALREMVRDAAAQVTAAAKVRGELLEEYTQLQQRLWALEQRQRGQNSLP